MSTQDVANRFHELVSSGNFRETMVELYADNARHVEAVEMPDMPYPRILEGKDKLLDMSDHWEKTNEVHDFSCGKPLVNGDQFICEMMIDTTPGEGPMAGQRMKMTEQCLYTVTGNKISEAKFFYGMDC